MQSKVATRKLSSAVGLLLNSDLDFRIRSRNHGLITGWRILAVLSIPMENMVGTTGLEPATSTVSRFAYSILPTTSRNILGPASPSKYV
jgi:hypothetical protein